MFRVVDCVQCNHGFVGLNWALYLADQGRAEPIVLYILPYLLRRTLAQLRDGAGFLSRLDCFNDFPK